MTTKTKILIGILIVVFLIVGWFIFIHPGFCLTNKMCKFGRCEHRCVNKYSLLLIGRCRIKRAPWSLYLWENAPCKCINNKCIDDKKTFCQKACQDISISEGEIGIIAQQAFVEMECEKEMDCQWIKREVTITTDKTEYEQGEEIKITIKNNLDRDIWLSIGPFGTKPLRLFSETIWIQEAENGSFERGKNIILTKPKELDETETTISAPPPPPILSEWIDKYAQKLEPGQILSFSWDGRKLGPEGNMIPAEGLYRIKFIYYTFDYEYAKSSNEIDYYYWDDNEFKTTIYSKEFTIKEKDETAALNTYKSLDQKKELIVRGSFLNWQFFIREDQEEREIPRFYVVGPYNIQWSPDSTKFAFTDAEVSNEHNAYVVDINTGEKIRLEGAKQFLENLAGTGTYTHIYTKNISWYDEKSLFVEVSGWPDDSPFRPEPQYFLVNSDTGKVIKQVSKEEVETANLKTYRNEEYKFEINYPKEWLVKEITVTPWEQYKEIECLSQTEIRSSKEYPPSEEKRKAQEFTEVRIQVFNNSKTLTINEWLDFYGLIGVVGEKDAFSPRNPIVIAKTQGIETRFGCCETVEKGVFLPKENKVYYICLAGTLRYLGNEEIFNKMLSTFRFLE